MSELTTYFKKSSSGRMALLVPPGFEYKGRAIRDGMKVTQLGSKPPLSVENMRPLERIYKTTADVELTADGGWPYPVRWPKNAEGMDHCTREEIKEVFGVDIPEKVPGGPQNG